MAKASQTTCKLCGMKIPSELKQVYQGKNYCVDCYKKIALENEQYKTLINAIFELCKKYDQRPNYMVYAQVKKLKEEYGFSYSGMKYTLWYIDEILEEIPNFEKYGVSGVIERYYTSALNWWQTQQRINESYKKLPKEHKVIYINSYNEVRPKSPLVNLDEIVERFKNKKMVD